MHNSKKWIIAYDGRLVRSRHRTRQDRYHGPSKMRLLREQDECAGCLRVSISRGCCHEHRLKWQSLLSRQFGSPPKWWRRCMNRGYRAKMKDLLRHAREEGMWPQPRREGWYW